MPPKASFVSIDSLGEVTISFNNEMNVFSELLTMSSEGISLDVGTGRVLTSEQVAVDFFDLRMVPGSEEADPEQLSFTWRVLQFSGQSLKLKMVFSKPLQISAADEKDQIEIRFKSKDWFVDKYG